MSLFSPAHETFRNQVRKFVEERLTPHADEWEASEGFPLSLFEEMGREGFFGLTYPRKYGGQELDFGYSVVQVEEWPRSRMLGLTLSLIAQTHFFLPLLNQLAPRTRSNTTWFPRFAGRK